VNNGLETIVRKISGYGWDIQAYDESYLLRLAEKRAATHNLASIEEYSDLLSGDQHEARIYFNSLNNSYSEFFRDPLTFAFLERIILPELLTEKKRGDRSELRIWSAGCASGQEAYSIAILLDELSACDTKELNFRIIATDNDSVELETGRQGVFSAAALQNVTLGRLGRYFDRLNADSYQVGSRIRERIDFSQFDLLDLNTFSPPASIFGEFDLVFCCNLLIYYGVEARTRILSRLQKSLVAKGYLVAGEAEKEMVKKTRSFCQVSSGSSVFKQSSK